MNKPATLIELCAANLSLSGEADASAPEWVHLVPAGDGGLIQTNDRRGPYRITDAQEVIARSLQMAGGRLPLDENHATDRAALRGDPSPARGWVVEMQARDDGIWGRVEWTAAGRELIETRAYRGISPALTVDKSKRVLAVPRASLVNTPNLKGLTTLHQEEENDMGFLQKLAGMLGLGADASEDEVTAAIAKALDKGGEAKDELNSELPTIAKALKLAEDADLRTVLNAIEEAPEPTEVTELQGEVATLATELQSVKAERAREKAEAYVDGEIKRGRAGLKPVRDRYITLHMKDPAEAEALIGAMPVLTGELIGGGVTALQSSEDPNEIALQAAEYQRKQADAGITIDFATAVTAVQEGKK